jgi:imidazolonepropionase-like amidohydrolase
MHKLLTATVLAAAAAAVHAQTPRPPSTIAFLNVTVLPMDREAVLPEQHVLVRDGKIVEIGPAARVRLPAGAIQLDGAGKFLMPTLAEMHAHIPGGKEPDALVEKTLFLYAANGVGTIRGMLGDPRHLQYRERAGKGELFSPRIYTSGPSLNGKTVPTAEAAAQAVVAQKAAGYDLLKIHPGVPRAAFDALDAKADEVGIPFAGHVPLDVGLQRALEAKYRSIDHLDGYVEALAREPQTSQFFGLNLVQQVDESKIPALVEATKKAGVWQVPTQVLFDSLLSEDTPSEMAAWPEMRYMPPATLKNWIEQKTNMTTKFSAADRRRFLELRRRILKALLDGGVDYALGSDAPQWWNVPGFSAHRELRSLVLAGFTRFQALQSGTFAAARYFGTEAETGSVATGKRADLLLLDANPLQDIANSTRIAGVMIAGRWMGRSAIDERLEGLIEPR